MSVSWFVVCSEVVEGSRALDGSEAPGGSEAVDGSEAPSGSEAVGNVEAVGGSGVVCGSEFVGCGCWSDSRDGGCRTLCRSSSVYGRAMTSFGSDDDVRPTSASLPNIAAYDARPIPLWRLEFF